MGRLNDFWGKTGGTDHFCAIADIPEWVPANSGFGPNPLAAGIFLDARNAYQGEFDGYLLAAPMSRSAEATHLVFRVVTANHTPKSRAIINGFTKAAEHPI